MSEKRLTLGAVIPFAGEFEYLDKLTQNIDRCDFDEIVFGIDSYKIEPGLAKGRIEESIERNIRGKQRVKVLISKGTGPSSVRNSCISLLKTDLVLPIDADDLISPNYPRIIRRIFGEGNSMNNVGIVYGPAEFIGEKKGPWNLPKYSMTNMILENCIYATAGFQRKDWELVGGYDESLIFGQEDWDFWLKLIGLGRQVRQESGKTVFFYRIRPGSRSSEFKKSPENILWTYDKICVNNINLMRQHIEVISNRRVQLEFENAHIIFDLKFVMKALAARYPKTFNKIARFRVINQVLSKSIQRKKND